MSITKQSGYVASAVSQLETGSLVERKKGERKLVNSSIGHLRAVQPLDEPDRTYNMQCTRVQLSLKCIHVHNMHSTCISIIK